jgi:hypothetical protein
MTIEEFRDFRHNCPFCGSKLLLGLITNSRPGSTIKRRANKLIEKVSLKYMPMSYRSAALETYFSYHLKQDTFTARSSDDIPLTGNLSLYWRGQRNAKSSDVQLNQCCSYCAHYSYCSTLILFNWDTNKLSNIKPLRQTIIQGRFKLFLYPATTDVLFDGGSFSLPPMSLKEIPTEDELEALYLFS